VAKRLLLALADDQLSRQLATKVLAPAGYGVIQVHNGPDLRKALQGKRADLLFLEDRLPGIDSFELAEELKSSHPTLPVVFLARKATREDLLRSMGLGFVDYLTFPLDKEAMLDAARRGVERKRRWDGWLKKEAGRITRPLSQRLSELESILEQVSDGVLLLDPQNRILMVNQTMRKAFALGDKNLQGQPIEAYFENSDFLRILQDPNAQMEHFEIESPKGSVYDLRVGRVPGVGTVASLHDISDLKQLDHLRKDFVNTVSHDLRSPLTAILGYVELIERAGPVNPQQSEFIKRVKSSVHTTTDLINDLLNLGRVEVGMIDELTPLDMKAIVAQAIETLQAQVQEKKQTLKLVDAGPLSPVLGSRTQLVQLVTNLIGNAIKYTPAGGEVRTVLREEQNQLILHVADNGPGIPLEEQERIFEKFYRASNAAADVQGTGLGLAIVKTIVENHRGRIWVDSKLGEGSVFTVVLPVAKQEKLG
jgi:signal transduction histidine kinase